MLLLLKHFRVSLEACVINFHLEQLLYIDINKNVISYFNTVKMLFNEAPFISDTFWQTNK